MTVPYGGDVANPMAAPERGPGVAGYVIGTLLIIAGIVGGIVWGATKIVALQDTIDDFDRAPVDEVRTFDLDEGDYVVYGERGGGEAISATLADFHIRPEGEEGGDLEVERYVTEFTFDDGNRPLRAEFTFEIDDAGSYEIQGDSVPGGATTVAVGPSVAGDLVSAVVGAIVIVGIGVVAGIVLLIVTGVRRRRFRQRGWQNTWNQPGTTPGGWNPPPPTGGYGAPPTSGAWNPPPPPGGGYPPPPG